MTRLDYQKARCRQLAQEANADSSIIPSFPWRPGHAPRWRRHGEEWLVETYMNKTPAPGKKLHVKSRNGTVKEVWVYEVVAVTDTGTLWKPDRYRGGAGA